MENPLKPGRMRGDRSSRYEHYIAAQSRGVKFGRPRKLNSEQEQLARKLIIEGKAVSEIAKVFNVHTATIYRLSSDQA